MGQGPKQMPNPRELTRSDIVRAATRFRSARKKAKWTVVVEGKEFPARPLVLEAAGVPPNDPTNSHQAVAILEGLGFKTRYEEAQSHDTAPGDSGDIGRSTQKPSIIDLIEAITKNAPAHAWENIPPDLSVNLDHYLYGAKKSQE